MNLGFDLDEVISQTSQMAVDYLNAQHGTLFTIEVFKSFLFDENTYSEDGEEQELIVNTLLDAIFNEELMSNLKPYPEAVKTLNLFKKQGHKIFIITKRPIKQTGLTVNWLRSNNISFDKLILTDNKDKGIYAKKFKLDCFVDDLQENLYDLYKAKARWTKNLVLMTRPWNIQEATDPSKIKRVHGWTDIIKHISISNRFRS